MVPKKNTQWAMITTTMSFDKSRMWVGVGRVETVDQSKFGAWWNWLLTSGLGCSLTVSTGAG